MGGLNVEFDCQEANEKLELIRLRLSGRIVTGKLHKSMPVAMSIEGQVAKLIEMASDERNLVQMYVGWNSAL